MRRGAVLLLLALAAAAGPARAQAPGADDATLRADGLPDAVAWWSAAGRAGYAPSTEWLGVEYPWTLAGLVRGGWSYDDAERMPGMHTGPGVAGAHEPLFWLDSLRVEEAGGDGAWRGFEAALVPVVGRTMSDGRPGGARSSSMFSFQRGSSALEENALALARDDSLWALRFEVASGDRGAVGAYEDAGAHRYGAAARLERGRQRFEGRFAHRGAAMNITGGAADQSAMGAGGAIAWSLRGAHDALRLELRRVTDWHESQGWVLVLPSRRDQSEDAAEASWAHEGAAARVALRGAAWRSQVRRVTDQIPDFDDKVSGWWVAGRAERGLGPLAADGSLGMGAQGGSGGLVAAPSLGLAARHRALAVALRLERIATPVWSDLAPDQKAFLQDTWTGALTLAAGDSARRVALTGRLGRTLDRAVAVRLPLEELWLREGYLADPESYRFALATFESAWRARDWGVTLEGFALARTRSPVQPEVDPANGLRATLEAGRHLFKGELGARLRGSVAVVGARQSEATGAWQSAYVTYGAGGVFTLADVVVVVEAIGLENQPHPLTWIDPRTGTDALGPGMETRVTLSWRLYN